MAAMDGLYLRAHAALREPDPGRKCRLAAVLRADWSCGRLSARSDVAVPGLEEPGRPERPQLVSPRTVERRRVASIGGRAALLHALAHIELNAVNLALDAVYRFRALPGAYYDDWLQVAAEEARHFSLLRAHLRTLGFDYGSFSAHDGLWEMARKTAHDPLVRMALVPRVLEARGLDATPALMAKLGAVGDARAVEILELIRREEIGHVRVGNRWYAYFCRRRGLEPLATFRRLLAQYDAPKLRPPFDLAARRRAGFTAPELAWLEALAAEAQPARLPAAASRARTPRSG